MGAMDFRVGGRIFATLASVNDGFGNLMLTPEVQAEFVAEAPDLFVPVAGGWGRMVSRHGQDVADVPLAEATGPRKVVTPELYREAAIFFG